MYIVRFITILVVLTLSAMSCGDNTPEEPTGTDTFDRTALLTHWAENIILPAYVDYERSTAAMALAIGAFGENPTATTLQEARAAWLEAYTSWQSVSMYNIGPAEQFRIGNFTNIYPTDPALIEQNITSQNANLSLPSNAVAQGYPAVEYLLYGNNQDDDTVVAQYDAPRIDYLQAITQVIADNAVLLADAWTDSYRTTFINESGSSATSSVNKMANDYVYHYEKTIRAAKVGIPAGIFSTEVLPDRVEGYYAAGVSKRLFLAALDDFIAFFNGQPFADTVQGPSYATYLDYLDNNENLAADILAQLNVARSMAEQLDDDFEQQVLDDNTQMLALYDELQKAVVLLKVDMMQTLNIKIDYVDADGD